MTKNEASSASHRTLWWRATSVVLVLAIATAGLIAWVDTPNSRYQRYPGHYQLIFGERRAVDVMIVGPSRLGYCVASDQLAASLSERQGREVSVVDLSYITPDIGFTYLLLRDALQRHQVKTLIVELSDRNYNADGSQGFFLLGTVADIIESNLHRRTAGWVRRAQSTVSEIALKIVDHLSLAVRADIHDLENLGASLVDGQDLSSWIPGYPHKLKQYYSKRTGADAPTPAREPDVHSRAFARWRYYIAKVQALAREHGASLLLFRSPRYYVEPLAGDALAELEAQLGAPIVQLDDATLADLNDGGYNDQLHCSFEGRNRFMRWLSDELTDS